MIKIYRYNQLRNTVKIDICSKGGLRGTLVFDQGNVFTKEFPTVQVRTASLLSSCVVRLPSNRDIGAFWMTHSKA